MVTLTPRERTPCQDPSDSESRLKLIRAFGGKPLAFIQYVSPVLDPSYEYPLKHNSQGHIGHNPRNAF